MMIKINDDREFEIKTLYSGYLEENKSITLEFEFPEYLEKYNKKANFELKDGTKVCKLFDEITSNKLTLTRDLLKYNKLQIAIEFFDTSENLIYRTSILTIIISDSIICDDDVSPEDSKVIILNELIQKVTELNTEVTENEATRRSNEETRISNENTRISNENKRIEEENKRISAESTRVSNEEKRVESENLRITQEETRQSNESTRTSNEEIREENETQRIANEEIRQENANQLSSTIEKKMNKTTEKVNLIEVSTESGAKGINGKVVENLANTFKTFNVEGINEVYVNGRNHWPNEPLVIFYDNTNALISYIDTGVNSQTCQDFKVEVPENAVTMIVNGRTEDPIEAIASAYYYRYLDFQDSFNNEIERVLKLIPSRTTEIQEVIDIDDSAESSFNQLKVFGNSEQKSTEGAAKVDFGAFAGDYSDEQMEIKIDENGIISLKGTVSAYYSKKIGTLTKDMFVAGNNAYYARSNNSNNPIIFMQSIGSISFSSVNNSPSFEITDESQESDLYIVVNYLESGTLNVNEILYPMISLESNTLYEPYTGGNPSPSPNYPQKINSVGRKSKNILDISNLYTESTINGVTVKYNNDGTLNLKGTSTANIDLYLREGVPLEHGNYTYKCFGLPENIYTNIYYAGDVYGETVKNFTVSNDNNYGIVIKIPINTTIDAVIKPMLVKGVYYSTTFPEFEPFYNSKIVKFKRLRKNLLDMSNARGGTSNGITVEIKQDGSYSYVGTATDNAINVWLRGDFNTYNSYRSWEELDKSLILFKLPKGNYVAKDCVVLYVLENGERGSSSTGLNLQDDAYVVAIRALNATIGNTYNEIKYPCIIQEDSDENFEVYNSDEYILPIQQNMYALVEGQEDCFVKKDGQWYERHYSFEGELTGEELINNMSNTHFDIYNINLYDFPNAFYTKEAKQYCNYFIFATSSTTIGYFYVSGNTIRLPKIFDTIEEMQSWIKSKYDEGNPLKIVYIRGETDGSQLHPLDLECTPEQTAVLNQLEQFSLSKGINHIFSDDELSPKFQLKYYQDMNILLDKINKNIADVSAEIL